ncbi:hypothetical protein HYPSUDRAFT_197645 [Hypholoma sublateritium FD-334 SS-4]|uniref:Uncharacterized protein n=1 Tax=Hypholoma sublateritium (strain FD-334 SS-4) TaxID=945553 RepID=A0A0D2PHZ8_HYPSF|nr:hypothetical protein HYPSUDRAFT_197645 [Hypholoma sublateritium FD-334 SS-4]
MPASRAWLSGVCKHYVDAAPAGAGEPEGDVWVVAQQASKRAAGVRMFERRGVQNRGAPEHAAWGDAQESDERAFERARTNQVQPTPFSAGRSHRFSLGRRDRGKKQNIKKWRVISGNGYH